MNVLRDPVLPRKRGRRWCGLCVDRGKRVRQAPAVGQIAGLPLCGKHLTLVLAIARDAGVLDIPA